MKILLLAALFTTVAAYTCTLPRPGPPNACADGRCPKRGLYMVDGNGDEWAVAELSGSSASFYMPEFNWLVSVDLIEPDDPRYEQPWQFTRIYDRLPAAVFANTDCQGEPLLHTDTDCSEIPIVEYPDPSTLPWQPVSPFGQYGQRSLRPSGVLLDPRVTLSLGQYDISTGEVTNCSNQELDFTDTAGMCGVEDATPADWQGVPPEPYILKFDRVLP